MSNAKDVLGEKRSWISATFQTPGLARPVIRDESGCRSGFVTDGQVLVISRLEAVITAIQGSLPSASWSLSR